MKRTIKITLWQKQKDIGLTEVYQKCDWCDDNHEILYTGEFIGDNVCEYCLKKYEYVGDEDGTM